MWGVVLVVSMAALSHQMPPAAEYLDNLKTLEEIERLGSLKAREEDMQHNVGDVDEQIVSTGKLEVVGDFPSSKLHVGQIGGIAVDNNENPVLFHRARRTWSKTSFRNNHLQNPKPIKEDVFAVLNKTSGKIIKSWGKGQFYMPHGLTIDRKGNYWVTDVGSHQVHKMEVGKSEPVLTLGTKLQAGRGKHQFCQPTDVAVASNGDFFVADGYCNSRIMRFNSKGEYIDEFGNGDFNVVHSLALLEDFDVICAADRDNFRILCYNAGLKQLKHMGNSVGEVTQDVGQVYAIAYSPKDQLIYGINGPHSTKEDISHGFTIDVTGDDVVLGKWAPENGFTLPHDLAVSHDGSAIFVGQIQGQPVWKFKRITMQDADDRQEEEEEQNEN